ncbi:MAG: enoyl-CoA hydratase [Pseudomonadota bacterium]|jgi:enoyl-CoA hydratase/carnithine racemase
MSPQAAQASNDAILLRHDQAGVATLTLNRPQQYNALSNELLGALLIQLNAIGDDKSLRVVVIAGAGKAFCAGHDLKEMRANYELGATEALFRKCSEVMLTLTKLPQPVIAKVHGMATAAGCQLVAQCDLAVCSDNATFATSGVNLGLFCSTPGVALARNLPRKQAMEMLLTGEFIDAQIAFQRGLVNRVVALEKLDQAVNELAQTIIAKPADVIALGKKLFYEQIELGLSAAYETASKTMACNFMLPEAAEGVDAFMQKRKPDWGHM